jgi:hypothetical protein
MGRETQHCVGKGQGDSSQIYNMLTLKLFLNISRVELRTQFHREASARKRSNIPEVVVRLLGLRTGSKYG